MGKEIGGGMQWGEGMGMRGGGCAEGMRGEDCVKRDAVRG